MVPLLVCLLLAPALPARPRVVLVGDSIRQGYAPLVQKALPEAEVISPKGAGDSAWLLKNLNALVLDHKPDLVHVNVGLHDLRKSRKDGSYQVPVEAYAKNLDALLGRLKKTKAGIVFVLTTPVDDERGKKRGGPFGRFDADVRRYNAAALGVCARHGVPCHDLYALVTRSGGPKIMTGDGTHYTSEGKAIQARAVADCVRRHLLIRKARPGKEPVGDDKATEAYKLAEKERDAGVPDVFRKLSAPAFEPPADAAAWKKRRPEALAAVLKSLGDLPPRPKPSAKLLSAESWPGEGFRVESLLIPNGVDGEMSALYFVPSRLGDSKAPAILWLHSSSYDARQLLTPGYNGGSEPLGITFVKAGYVVLAPDACWYGHRSGKGPGGPPETTRAQQESLLKYNLWMGRTLWGMFVRDDQVALDYLCSRPEVDAGRVGATGMSMGSTRSWWLAAVDERVRCVVGVACLTRYQNLIAHGQLRQHGVYYFVFGLMKHFDVEGVLALIAPRPYLALTGELDAGSPADGIVVIEEKLGRVYAALGAKEAFRSVRYKHTGHVYTPAMRREMLRWFGRWLSPRPGASR